MAKTVKIIKKALGTFFLRLKALTNCKVSENQQLRRETAGSLDFQPFFKQINYQILMNGLRKKCENLHFLAFWAKMANFGQILAKMGFFFQKKCLEHFCRAYNP